MLAMAFMHAKYSLFLVNLCIFVTKRYEFILDLKHAVVCQVYSIKLLDIKLILFLRNIHS